jgi:general stress protein 26
MSQLTLEHVAEQMRGIDIAILSTHASHGRIACRPMSNNGDVKYNGTSFFFSDEKATCVSDIERDPNVALGYSSSGSIGGSVYVAVEGTAKLIRDKGRFERHWTPDLDAWFKDGIKHSRVGAAGGESSSYQDLAKRRGTGAGSLIEKIRLQDRRVLCHPNRRSASCRRQWP